MCIYRYENITNYALQPQKVTYRWEYLNLWNFPCQCISKLLGFLQVSNEERQPFHNDVKKVKRNLGFSMAFKQDILLIKIEILNTETEKGNNIGQ